MEDQTKKIALVIGGSRGIGSAIALRLADSGFDIWLTYKSNHPAAESVKADIEKKGRNVRAVVLRYIELRRDRGSTGEDD